MDMNFEFFSIEPTTIIGVLCNTLILVLLFKKFLFEPVNKILDERKKSVTQTYLDADKALSEAKEMREEYSQRIAGAKEESAAMIAEASRKASARSDEIITEARQQAALIRQRADEDIERERVRAVNSVKDEISNLALDIAGKVIGHQVSSDTEQERLIHDFLNELDDSSN